MFKYFSVIEYNNIIQNYSIQNTIIDNNNIQNNNKKKINYIPNKNNVKKYHIKYLNPLNIQLNIKYNDISYDITNKEYLNKCIEFNDIINNINLKYNFLNNENMFYEYIFWFYWIKKAYIDYEYLNWIYPTIYSPLICDTYNKINSNLQWFNNYIDILKKKCFILNNKNYYDLFNYKIQFVLTNPFVFWTDAKYIEYNNIIISKCFYNNDDIKDIWNYIIKLNENVFKTLKRYYHINIFKLVNDIKNINKIKNNNKIIESENRILNNIKEWKINVNNNFWHIYYDWYNCDFNCFLSWYFNKCNILWLLLFNKFNLTNILKIIK